MNEARCWLARFPTPGLREEFLRLVRLWNRIEDLPAIEAEPLGNGVGVRVTCAGGEDRGVRRLVDAFGGSIGAVGAAMLHAG